MKRLFSRVGAVAAAALMVFAPVSAAATEGSALAASAAAVAAVSGAATAAAAQDPADAAPCEGRFVNPITDVCWSCLFPLTLGLTKRP